MATRRSLLQAAFGSLAAVGFGPRMRVRADPALQKVKVVIPANSVFVLN